MRHHLVKEGCIVVLAGAVTFCRTAGDKLHIRVLAERGGWVAEHFRREDPPRFLIHLIGRPISFPELPNEDARTTVIELVPEDDAERKLLAEFVVSRNRISERLLEIIFYPAHEPPVVWTACERAASGDTAFSRGSPLRHRIITQGTVVMRMVQSRKLPEGGLHVWIDTDAKNPQVVGGETRPEEFRLVLKAGPDDHAPTKLAITGGPDALHALLGDRHHFGYPQIGVVGLIFLPVNSGGEKWVPTEEIRTAAGTNAGTGEQG